MGKQDHRCPRLQRNLVGIWHLAFLEFRGSGYRKVITGKLCGGYLEVSFRWRVPESPYCSYLHMVVFDRNHTLYYIEFKHG